MKACLAVSGGGHLYQLYQLRKCWIDIPHFWVTFNTPDVQSLLNYETKYFAYYPESRNMINAIKNLFLAFKIMRKEKPDVLISCGAGIAPPFFLAARLLRIHIIYLEPIDFIYQPSLTGRICYKLADLFLIQNIKLKKFFPRAEYWGTTLSL